jgi:transcriptional coactivator HFI1/ADA1
MSLLGKVCTNGPGFVRTGEFKKRVEREEAGGGLRIEAEERRKRKMLCMEDLKLALQLGDGYLGQTPLIAGGIYHSRCLDTEGIDDLYADRNGDMVNGHGGEVWNVDFGNANGAVNGGDPMDIDGEENWQGGDAEGLDGVLDDVLNLADI